MKLHNIYYYKRIEEIITVFFEEGFGFLIKKAKLHKFVPFSKRIKATVTNREKSWKPEVQLRKAFERLGPTFIKFGQILSLRPDVLPAEYITEFERMQDRVPPIPFKEIKKAMEEEFHKPLHQIFASFDSTPIASASLAQVYKARLKTGETVAVKVLRPGISRIVQEDMEVMTSIAHWCDKHKVLARLPLPQLVEEFKRWTLHELNVHYEATNLHLFRENFRNSKDIIIPKVFDRYSTEHVLVLEFIKGIPLHDIKNGKRSNGKNIIRKAYHAMMEMMLLHGLFHGDPHPGNILVVKNRVAFVDFGIVGRLDQELRTQVLKLMKAISEGDSDRAADILIDLRTTKQLVDVGQLKRDLNDILGEIKYQNLEEVNIGSLLAKVVDAVNRYKLYPPVDFVLFAKSMITLEGLGLRYDPKFRVLSETKELLRDIIQKETTPKALIKRAKQQLRNYEAVIERTPSQIATVMQRLAEGKIEVEVVPREFYELRTELEHSAGNIAIGVMTAAIIIGSAIIMNISVKNEVWGMPFLSLVGFALSGMLGLWLIKRTIFTKHYGGDGE